jgi:uncharacterized protein (DUF488 family)
MHQKSARVPIYTIGYGDRSIDDFIAVLQRYAIKYLIDVRTAPYSRYKPEFSKAALERSLQAAGIRYLFLGDALGGRPDDPSCYTDDKVDYEKVKSKEFYHRGLARIQTAFQQQQTVALMCSEGKPEQCHRSRLIGVSLEEMEVPVAHIDENDELQGQQDVILGLTKGQLGLFGDPEFTSRKRYRRQDDAENELDDSDIEV